MANQQHGVVSIEQLKGLGYSTSAVGRAVMSGWLHSIDRSVYAVGHTRLSPEGQCFAAVFACGPGAVLSHHSAAWVHGLARWKSAPFHVTGRWLGDRGCRYGFIGRGGCSTRIGI